MKKSSKILSSEVSIKRQLVPPTIFADLKGFVYPTDDIPHIFE